MKDFHFQVIDYAALSNETMYIYIYSWMEPFQRKILAEHITDDKLVFARDYKEEERKKLAAQADIIFGNVPLSYLTANLSLQWLQLESAGIDPYRSIDWQERNTLVTNMKGLYGIPVAETAMAGILALYRKINDLVLLQNNKEWNYKYIRRSVKTLYQQEVLILGAGSIGSRIKELLIPFDCRITVFAKGSPKADITDIGSLEKKLETADLIVAALPETNETVQLIDAKRISMMKKGAFLANVGRGSLIDENALIKALQDNHLGGSYLDVTSIEPLPTDHPLWECPNLILSQHTSGGSQTEVEQKIAVFLENYHKFIHSEPLSNLVDFKKGY